MPSSLSRLLPSIFACVSSVLAHGRITNVTVLPLSSSSSSANESKIYPGFDPQTNIPPSVSPPSPAWTAFNLGNIYVSPSSFNTSDIVCHFNATPGTEHIDVVPEQELRLQWNEWPNSHKGPVLTYLASCGKDCTDVDKSALEWVKIDELGWLNSSGMAILGGTWASDVLISQRFSWVAKVPDELASGAYVLRHEIIALHVADEPDGAQAYPQCVNLRVGNGGTKKIEGGVKGDELYTATDAGISVDIHRGVTSYAIPGPKVWKDATAYRQTNQKRAIGRIEER
ncbi:glycoside hydrolase [Polyplosphaeria fusca]|uniref:lytic cellulose monooxygenase (C4-dehydrogenating) n=1 Tax=Polyplosphaeria fusca TaxID=682080 RepID=A0A9P4QM19_9PLEO|nr:glycoside hydrolase [Polyplosphaeria fusca]